MKKSSSVEFKVASNKAPFGTFDVVFLAVCLPILWIRVTDCQGFLCSSSVYIFLLAVWVYHKLSLVTEESLMAVRNLGVQITVTYLFGRKQSKFIPSSQILDIVINEGISMCQVHHYMCVLMRNADEMTVIFENTMPSLGFIQKVHQEVRSTMNIVSAQTEE